MVIVVPSGGVIGAAGHRKDEENAALGGYDNAEPTVNSDRRYNATIDTRSDDREYEMLPDGTEVPAGSKRAFVEHPQSHVIYVKDEYTEKWEKRREAIRYLIDGKSVYEYTMWYGDVTEKISKEDVRTIWYKKVKIFEKLPTGETHCWTKDGVMIYEKLGNIYEAHYSDEGIKTYERDLNGKVRTWTKDGKLTFEGAPCERQRNIGGEIVYERLPTGDEYRWHNGGLRKEEKVGTNCVKYDRGLKSISTEVLSDGRERVVEWCYGCIESEVIYGQGLMRYSDRTETKWDKWGNVIYHMTKGKEDTEDYIRNQRKIERIRRKKENFRKVKAVATKMLAAIKVRK